MCLLELPVYITFKRNAVLNVNIHSCCFFPVTQSGVVAPLRLTILLLSQSDKFNLFWVSRTPRLNSFDLRLQLLDGQRRLVFPEHEDGFVIVSFCTFYLL